MSGGVWMAIGHEYQAAIGGDGLVHAVHWRELTGPMKGPPHLTACGQRVIKLYGVATIAPDGTGEATLVMPWPPYETRHLTDGLRRCRGCWDATGKRRPAGTWNQLIEETPCPKE